LSPANSGRRDFFFVTEDLAARVEAGRAIAASDHQPVVVGIA
jgi:exonuclease III